MNQYFMRRLQPIMILTLHSVIINQKDQIWKIQGVSERTIQKCLLISLVVHILERCGMSAFFTDIGTF